jgi:FkbM family methyltransferase
MPFSFKETLQVGKSARSVIEISAIIRDGICLYYQTFGFRGVLAVSSHCLFGYPREIKAYPPGICYPLRIRLRTADVPVYVECLLDGEYAFDLPFDPETIVDAGANIGLTSIYFANKYPKAKIIAVEAEASNFSVLKRNVQPYLTIFPVHAALWNRDGETSVGERPAATGGKSAFVVRDGPGVKTRAITMQTLLREMSAQIIDLVKIDIEGAEKEVFEDTSWLTDVKCVMIELHDRFRPGCTEAVESAMQGFARTKRGSTVFYVRSP